MNKLSNGTVYKGQECVGSWSKITHNKVKNSDLLSATACQNK